MYIKVCTEALSHIVYTNNCNKVCTPMLYHILRVRNRQICVDSPCSTVPTHCCTNICALSVFNYLHIHIEPKCVSKASYNKRLTSLHILLYQNLYTTVFSYLAHCNYTTALTHIVPYILYLNCTIF